jgi:hypothetical protein
MESCWLINFEDGHRMIISEELYKEEVKKNWNGRARRSEEHWFNFKQCRAMNRGIPYFGSNLAQKPICNDISPQECFDAYYCHGCPASRGREENDEV